MNDVDVDVPSVFFLINVGDDQRKLQANIREKAAYMGFEMEFIAHNKFL